jgi:hypothetical protein
LAERVLKRLRKLQDKGECDLVFGDETGFSLQPRLPYLWQLKGKTVGIPAQAHSKRINVIGFLHDSGDLFWHHIKQGRVDGAEFIAAVEAISYRIYGGRRFWFSTTARCTEPG